MRRSIDSEYIRKKRTSRRPANNWRRLRTNPHIHKYGHQKMLSDYKIEILGIITAILWISVTAWMIWDAFK